MSKAGNCSETVCPRPSCRSALTEDLRLDCLRLALQRQGARDSRDLLEIAEEYFRWVTAENGGPPEEVGRLTWPPVQQGATLSPVPKRTTVRPASAVRKRSQRRPRAAPNP